MRLPVFIASQNGKTILSGSISYAEVVKELRSQNIAVNARAQRSLGSGANKESTAELLESDRVHTTPRMKAYVKFLHRVINQVNEGKHYEGFFGALQFSIPEEFAGARLKTVRPLDPENHKVPQELHDVINALAPNRKLGVLELQPQFGEVALNIGDGQGRIVGAHSTERIAVNAIVKQKKFIQKKEKAGEKVDEERRELERLEAHLMRIRKYLSETELSFTIYAAKVNENGQVIGLSDESQMRQYIEGNALNSSASQEEVLKYEQFSPVVMLLREVRTAHDWMGPAYIEEDSKTISSASTKLFTLSALIQAFTFSVLGNNQALKVDERAVEKTDAHEEFVKAFWAQVTEIFGAIWVPDADQTHSQRIAYLKEMRGDNHRCVVFQAIFLMALGRLCYQMGIQSKWDPQHLALDKIKLLSPTKVNYDAVDPSGKWDSPWVSRMMKQSLDKETGKIQGYSFNNTSENVDATYRELARIAEFGIDQNVKDVEPEVAPMA
jgi:hypothetical protein